MIFNKQLLLEFFNQANQWELEAMKEIFSRIEIASDENYDAIWGKKTLLETVDESLGLLQSMRDEAHAED